MTLNNESIKTAPNRHGTLMKYCGFALAVAAAFTAVYLFSGNRGAWQGVPIILFAPVISDILFKNSKAVCAVYALIAFIMSRFDGESIEYSVKYTAVVLGIAVVSIFVKRLVVTALVYKENRKLFAALFVFAAVICAAALFVYPMYNGTFFGNEVMPSWFSPSTLIVSPSGGFLVLGGLIALVQFIMSKKKKKGENK